MAALTADRNTPRRAGDIFLRAQKGATTIYAGALVCLDAAGFAVPGGVATTLKSDGISHSGGVNAGADGSVTLQVRPGIYRWDNSAAGDLITQADIGANCYVVDDHTVAKTNGGATRSVCGLIRDVDAQGVWVVTGQPKFGV